MSAVLGGQRSRNISQRYIVLRSLFGLRRSDVLFVLVFQDTASGATIPKRLLLFLGAVANCQPVFDADACLGSTCSKSGFVLTDGAHLVKQS